MLSMEPERQSGRRTEHRQRIFGKERILFCMFFSFYFVRTYGFLFVSNILHFSLPLSSFLPGPRDKRKHCWCKANQVAGSPPL